MGKRELILSVVAGISLIIISISISFLLSGNSENVDMQNDISNLHGLSNSDSLNQENLDAEGAEEDYLYILKEFNGKIGVFRVGREFPDSIFDVYVSSLPESDQEYLIEGIKVKDQVELRNLKEDYSSWCIIWIY